LDQKFTDNFVQKLAWRKHASYVSSMTIALFLFRK